MFLQRNYHWCQQKLTNVYLYKSAPSPVLCFSLVMMTQLWCPHNSHSLLSAAHHYHNFSSPVNIKQSFNIHYGVQCILYKLVMKHFKPNLKYFACPCKSHIHTHTHTQTHTHVCVCVCVYIYIFQHSSRSTTHSKSFQPMLTTCYACSCTQLGLNFFAHFSFPAEPPLQINTALQMISGAMCDKSILAAITFWHSKKKLSTACTEMKILIVKPTWRWWRPAEKWNGVYYVDL